MHGIKNIKVKLNYVIGDEWYGGNLSYHLKSRPKWISINDKKQHINLLKSKDNLNGAMIGKIYIQPHLIGDK